MWVLSSFCFVVEGGHGLNSSLGILWQACPGGARILRVFGDSPAPRCQCRLKGSLLWRSAPTALRRTSAASLLMPDFGALTAAAPLLTPTPLRGFCAGRHPAAGVRALHNAAFYNCRKLEWLCAGSALESVGSDLFTNCRELDRFILDAAPDAPTG